MLVITSLTFKLMERCKFLVILVVVKSCKTVDIIFKGIPLRNTLLESLFGNKLNLMGSTPSPKQKIINNQQMMYTLVHTFGIQFPIPAQEDGLPPALLA